MNSAKGYSVFIQVLMYSFLYVPNNGKRLIETTPTLMMFSKKLARNYEQKGASPTGQLRKDLIKLAFTSVDFFFFVCC